MSRVVLAMSGGVDSSVAAHLLQQQGHDVIGVFMRHGHESPAACAVEPAEEARRAAASRQLPIVDRLDHKQGCCTAADAEDARRVADGLGIPFYALNLDREFGRIIDYFVDEYAAGRTPNPCVQCNNWIKFGKLFDYADAAGAEFVATGHYARLEPVRGAAEPRLVRGRDAGKDQSYVLFGIGRELLPRMLLPVGDYDKPAIRAIAEQLGLNVAAKKDSQEICFVTSGRYDQFVRGYQQQRGEQAGRGGQFVLTDGTVVGEHGGVESFTVGQRKGLGIALGEPKFVVRIEPDTRRVVLGNRDELGRRQLMACQCNWLVDPASLPAKCQVQVRYNSRAAAAACELLPDGRLNVQFDQPQLHVAPGQAAVCYDGERVLGGGWIE
ncbi:MAG: tRNA 2-thiouridine(34) synthase MnmA [Planctomycetaceae bacterium]|nr:tRNA 2-thiouridine(34) synthase MnmA [Planctomycetaceae bacterium]